MTGKITFVDSATGEEGSADIAQGAAGDPIAADYNGAVKEITVAISESPVSEVPEPSTTILLMAGMMSLGSKRLARSRGAMRNAWQAMIGTAREDGSLDP